jgi:hypothetical protein
MLIQSFFNRTGRYLPLEEEKTAGQILQARFPSNRWKIKPSPSTCRTSKEGVIRNALGDT